MHTENTNPERACEILRGTFKIKTHTIMKFNNLKIRTKLLAGFFSVIAVLIIVGLIGFNGLTMVGKQLNEVTTKRLPEINDLMVIKEGQTAIMTCQRSLLIENYPLPDFRASVYKINDETWKRIDVAWNNYLKLKQSIQEKRVWDNFVISWNAWRNQMPEFISLCKREDD